MNYLSLYWAHLLQYSDLEDHQIYKNNFNYAIKWSYDDSYDLNNWRYLNVSAIQVCIIQILLKLFILSVVWNMSQTTIAKNLFWYCPTSNHFVRSLCFDHRDRRFWQIKKKFENVTHFPRNCKWQNNASFCQLHFRLCLVGCICNQKVTMECYTTHSRLWRAVIYCGTLQLPLPPSTPLFVSLFLILHLIWFSMPICLDCIGQTNGILW